MEANQVSAPSYKANTAGGIGNHYSWATLGRLPYNACPYDDFSASHFVANRFCYLFVYSILGNAFS